VIGDRLSRSSKEIDELRQRMSVLDTIVEAGAGRIEPSVLERAEKLRVLSNARLGHGTSHTVVALAGATGSGKSSLFNAVSGTSFATVGVRRPTTSQAFAVVFGEGANELLDWLAIPQRQRIEAGPQTLEMDGLVLVDLPDHDSTETANRAEVERLVEVVDVFVWVVDPQKYADASLHDGFLQRFAGHSAVTIVVLNQVDRLTPAERTACIEDLTRLLVADGLSGVRVMAVSASTGDGIDALRRELGARVAERRALVRRLDADFDWMASDLGSAVGDTIPDSVSSAVARKVIESATDAAGARAIEHAVDRSYRHRASGAVGWPPLRWVRRLKSDPLARIGLGSRTPEENSAGTSAATASGTVSVRRTAIVSDPVANGQLSESLRALERDVTAGLPDAPRNAVARTIADGELLLRDALDRAVGSTNLHVDAPRWWTVAGGIQKLSSLGAAVGLAWLGVLFVLQWFQIPDPPMPRINSWPLPTLLALGGLALGFLTAVVGRRLAAIGAQKRAERARSALADEVGVVVAAVVLDPVNAELGALSSLAANVRKFAR
jgi:GTP-binding protein EngB required for normal cell division